MKIKKELIKLLFYFMILIYVLLEPHKEFLVISIFITMAKY